MEADRLITQIAANIALQKANIVTSTLGMTTNIEKDAKDEIFKNDQSSSNVCIEPEERPEYF